MVGLNSIQSFFFSKVMIGMGLSISGQKDAKARKRFRVTNVATYISIMICFTFAVIVLDIYAPKNLYGKAHSVFYHALMH